MTILDIYSQYQIPPNLQRHQLEVAAVCQVILDGWQGEKIDRDLTIMAALLHDMGNIIKFKRPFIGEVADRAEHWQKVQELFIAKYGKNVIVATLEIAQELELTDVVRVLQEVELLIAGKVSNSWEARLVKFADMHVKPEGIVSFDERLQDMIDRYHSRGDEVWAQAVKENHRLVNQQTSIDVSTIEKIDFLPVIDRLRRKTV